MVTLSVYMLLFLVPLGVLGSYNLSRSSKLRSSIVASRNESVSLIRAFVHLAKLVHNAGGFFSYEWPKGASGWREPIIQQLLAQLHMHYAEVHGCSVEMRGQNNGLMHKPWTLGCSSDAQAAFLGQLKCTKDHKHVPCSGSFTKGSVSYSFKMSRLMLESYECAIKARKKESTVALPASVVCPSSSEACAALPSETSTASASFDGPSVFDFMEEESDSKRNFTQMQHREKCFGMHFLNALIAKRMPNWKKDPRGIEAILKENDKLVKGRLGHHPTRMGASKRRG